MSSGDLTGDAQAGLTPPAPGAPALRLHPLTILVEAGRELAAALVAGTAALLVGGAGAAFYFALTGLVFAFGYHLAKWATFTYRVHADRVELRRALVGRSVTTIPRERIRGVDISAPPAHRLLGLAIVHIDAGSEGGEGELRAVSRAEAERLRGTLLRGDGAAAEPAAGATGGKGAQVLARARPRWYLFAPFSGAYLLTPFALAGSLLGALYNLGDELDLIDDEQLARLGDDVAGLPRAVFLAVALAFAVAMPVVSIIAFALFNWDFTLRYGQGGTALVAERGLITRRSVTLERRRIRGVELADHPFERAAGVIRLNALVTGLDDTAHRGSLLPAAPRTAAVRAAAQVMGGRLPGPLVRHPRAARRRRLVRAVGPPLALAVAAAAAGRTWALYPALAAALLAVPLGLDRYRQLGHATDGARLSVRSGSLRRRRVVIEHRAVVAWRLRQTVFQRRLGLATLTVGVGAGGGAYSAVDMGEHDAVAFAHGITPDWVAPFLADEEP
ncbi:PH domain-containing protein [Thermomonospora cellulosilytica]|uniref:Putative membrane protein n=1 Tax=Thermomonospora cellulosilytica TaxID=1411118 RepID=A0A7W3MZ64_9ACTN|nr:PH domain-containing protein [Thermomonospora cellulosilytica]MBA9004522.1 putative membrane protein [Thermomonospora cellulosilytica]